MATRKVYQTPGAAASFKDATLSPTVVFTPKNEAAAKGRISAQWDRGAGSQPARYKWRMLTRWAATATGGDTLRVYLVSSDGTNADGTMGATDVELSAETQLANNCQFLGTVVSGGADQLECSSGVCWIHDRYVQVAVWNGAATKALTNTAGDHIFTLIPIPDDIQAPA
jgi:hypothetical protein